MDLSDVMSCDIEIFKGSIQCLFQTVEPVFEEGVLTLHGAEGTVKLKFDEALLISSPEYVISNDYVEVEDYTRLPNSPTVELIFCEGELELIISLNEYN